MINNKLYIGYQKEPFTACERKRLRKLKACNDNELSKAELSEKSKLLGKEMEAFKNMGIDI